MWINVQDELPPIDVLVFVKGDFAESEYLADLPMARLNAPEQSQLRGMWSSREWRGMVGVRYWWKDDKQE